MNPLRKAALERLNGVQGAFLRCDRGGALYVTNAPARTDEAIDWAQAGLQARNEGKLTFLIPMDSWVEPFSIWLRAQVGEGYLTGRLSNACFGETDEADIRLWIEGIKRLDLRGEAAGYEKMVRQRAAECLREKKGGGTIAACALIADYLREGGKTDED